MILVTGASGMLGQRLVHQLVEDGEEVRVMLRPHGRSFPSLPVHVVHGDVHEPADVAAAVSGCSQVFHTAGVVSYSPTDAERAYRTNVIGTRNVLRASMEAGVDRVVHTSSTAAVGLTDEPRCLDEKEPFDPRLRRVAYMWTKHLAEVEVADAIAKGLDVVTVNPSTLVGAGDVNMNAGHVFAQLHRGALRFAPPGGNSFVGVEDAVRGHLLAMRRGAPGRRYILSSGNLTYREWLSRVAAALGRGPIDRVLPRWTETPLALGAAIASWIPQARLTPAMVFFSYRHRWFTSDRAHRELGWTPAQGFDSAAREAVSWYAQRGLLGRPSNVRSPNEPLDAPAREAREA